MIYFLPNILQSDIFEIRLQLIHGRDHPEASFTEQVKSEQSPKGIAFTLQMNDANQYFASIRRFVCVVKRITS